MDDPVDAEEGLVDEASKKSGTDVVDEDQDDSDEDNVTPMVTRSWSHRDRSSLRPVPSTDGEQSVRVQPNDVQSEEVPLNFEGALRVRAATGQISKNCVDV